MKEADCLIWVAAAWHLKKAPSSELTEAVYACCGATEDCHRQGSPVRSCLYPPLGALVLRIFFSSSFKGDVEAPVLVKRASEGDAGENRDTENSEGKQKLLPIPIPMSHAVATKHPWVHSHNICCPDRAGEGPFPPPLISLAFPPPFISFGFSPFIKLLACRNVK